MSILVYNFTIVVRLHNFFTVVLCIPHKGRGFSITPVTSENLRILVYDFTIVVRLHNLFTVVLCISHKGGGFSITPCNFCKSVNPCF